MICLVICFPSLSISTSLLIVAFTVIGADTLFVVPPVAVAVGTGQVASHRASFSALKSANAFLTSAILESSLL